MPAGRGEEERFAAEVEYGPGVGDDGADGLARELELVALLRSAGPALSPAPAARSRAKERLMAAFAAQNGSAQNGWAQNGSPAQHVADRAVGHADDTGPIAAIAPPATASPEGRHAEPTPLRPRRGRHAVPEPDASAEDRAPGDDLGPGGNRSDHDASALHSLGGCHPGPDQRLRRNRAESPGHRRAALLGAAAAAALVALAGTGTFASQNALPGDPMYGVKRVAESTGYALTFGEQAKARRHLEQAQRRLDEVEGMVTRDRAPRAGEASTDPADQELVRSTMQEFDADASEGSRLLLSGPADAAQVDDVREWAAEQSARLAELRSAMPAQDKADESLALLDRLLDATAAAPECDPALETCPTTAEGEPVDGAVDGEPLPDGVVPGATEPRTTRGGSGGSADDPADDATATDDEQAPRGGSSDDDAPSDDRNRDGSGRSGGSGGSGGGDAARSDDPVSVPLPLPAPPVNVPPVVPGLPGLSLGG